MLMYNYLLKYQQHQQRGEQELDADHLVVGREDVLLEERQLGVPVVVGVLGNCPIAVDLDGIGGILSTHRVTSCV